ncbi:MAG: alpha/beta fold hydrolase [Gemmatimonadota bacterium]|nr:alpha/beta fold hydrolase [Gemmatimonadota bacterium]
MPSFPAGAALSFAPGPAVRSAPALRSPPALRSTLRTRIDFDHLGPRTVPVDFEAVGPDHAPTVVLGGISAGRHLAPTSAHPEPGWWRGVVEQGGALDPARWLLIGMDFLGGPCEDDVLRPVTTHDQARALAAVLDHLGIAATSLVGASYGGMVALAFAELFPARVSKLVILGAAHRTHPMATAVRTVQRAAATLGAETGHPARGLALARALAMTTYRSIDEFETRFSPFAVTPGTPGTAGTSSAPGTPATPGHTPSRFPVEDYLDSRGAAFAEVFTTDRFLALSESIDLHGTRPGSLPPDALLVSFDTDVIVPPWLVDELARGQGQSPVRQAQSPVRQAQAPVRHVTIPSLFGHDAFLKETGEVARQITQGLAEEEAAR